MTPQQAALHAALRTALKPVEGPLTYGRRNAQALASLRGLEGLAQRGLSQSQPLALTSAVKTLLDRLVAGAAAFDHAPASERFALLEELHCCWARLVGDLPMPAGQPGSSDSNSAPVTCAGAPASEASPGRPRVRSLSAEGSLAPAALEGEVLQRPLSSLRGIGPAVTEKLASRGLRTLGDALLYLPRQYEDRREAVTIDRARPGQKALLRARIVSFEERHVRRAVYELHVEDDTGALTARWFGFKPGAYRAFLPGTAVVLSGEVRAAYRGGKEIIHPDLELGEAADDPASFGHVVPVYTDIEGVSARFYRRIARQVVDACRGTPIDEFYAPRFRAQHGLVTLGEALSGVHFPPDDVDFPMLSRFASPGQRRLVFDELFFVQLGLALRKRGVEVAPGLPMRTDEGVMERALARLPFKPTRAQQKALGEVAKDMARSTPMSRLLQGDVGSGKTAVALAAAMLAVENGYQAALMAPTELLAEQHARTFEKLLGGGLFQKRTHDLPPVHTVLLSAGRPGKELKRSLHEVESGTARIVVGTHSLLSEGVRFANLGLAIVDEQHRFGVLQRAQLTAKGKTSPHVLVMTATPIPRTLALTLYGDLDVSVIDELPPGRTPVTTKAFSGRTRAKAYEVVRREVAAGHQAYVVLPLVEESEKIELRSAVAEFERLGREELAGLSLGLVHGRMSPEERSAAMEAFRLGRTQVLVATTVIEVGVDVPNASVMLIEHSERFGLSQLHQLRGRVGRGAAKSYCLLVHEDDKASMVARQRLEVMVRTSDGFKLSESDLEIRGPGEFLGTRQSGLPDLVVADLLRDREILQQARDAAFDLVRHDPELKRPEHAGIAKELARRWADRMSLARIG
jgi:ATP-dependent DNA helicase RecG